jgi:hypothetical protein
MPAQGAAAGGQESFFVSAREPADREEPFPPTRKTAPDPFPPTIAKKEE